MPPGPTGLRPPQQRRSRESLERVLRAGEALLAQSGYDGFTIAEVSREAKVSVGSVYGRFENKDALVYEIHRRMLERMRPSAQEAALAAEETSELDLRGAVEYAIRRLAGSTDAERALLRAFMLRGAVDARIAGPGSEASQAAGRLFKAIILARRDEIGHPDPELASDVSYRMAYDVLSRHVMYGPTFESDTGRTWDELVGELIEAAVAYLRFGGRDQEPNLISDSRPV
jgi:AcrR family transcriptional regulator